MLKPPVLQAIDCGVFNFHLDKLNFNWQAMFDRGFQLTTAGSEVALLREVAVNIVREYTNKNPK